MASHSLFEHRYYIQLKVQKYECEYCQIVLDLLNKVTMLKKDNNSKRKQK